MGAQRPARSAPAPRWATTTPIPLDSARRDPLFSTSAPPTARADERWPKAPGVPADARGPGTGGKGAEAPRARGASAPGCVLAGEAPGAGRRAGMRLHEVGEEGAVT